MNKNMYSTVLQTPYVSRLHCSGTGKVSIDKSGLCNKCALFYFGNPLDNPWTIERSYSDKMKKW